MYNDYAAINANWWDLVMMMMFIGTETLVTQLVSRCPQFLELVSDSTPLDKGI